MLSDSTSAGRSVVSARSMLQDPLDGLGGDALAGADDRHQLVEQPLGERDLAGLAVQGDPVAADVDLGVEAALDQAEVLVPGTEQADHVDAVGHHDGVTGLVSVPDGCVCHGCPGGRPFWSTGSDAPRLRRADCPSPQPFRDAYRCAHAPRRRVRRGLAGDDAGPDAAPPYWFAGQHLPDDAAPHGLTHHVPDGALLDFAGSLDGAKLQPPGRGLGAARRLRAAGGVRRAPLRGRPPALVR